MNVSAHVARRRRSRLPASATACVSRAASCGLIAIFIEPLEPRRQIAGVHERARRQCPASRRPIGHPNLRTFSPARTGRAPSCARAEWARRDAIAPRPATSTPLASLELPQGDGNIVIRVDTQVKCWRRCRLAGLHVRDAANEAVAAVAERRCRSFGGNRCH